MIPCQICGKFSPCRCDQEIIESLFVLEYMRTEYSRHLNMKLNRVKFDEYNYAFMIDQANFKMVKDLLIIEGECCSGYKHLGYGVVIELMHNYIKSDTNQ